MKVLIIIACVLLYILCGTFVAVLVRDEIDDDSGLFLPLFFGQYLRYVVFFGWFSV